MILNSAVALSTDSARQKCLSAKEIGNEPKGVLKYDKRTELVP
jgi:hypothetical protein